MIKKVKWFNDAKGYGFLDNGEMEDIFVRRKDLNLRPSGYEPDELTRLLHSAI